MKTQWTKCNMSLAVMVVTASGIGLGGMKEGVKASLQH